MTRYLSKVLLDKGVTRETLPKVIPLFRRVLIPPSTITLSAGDLWNDVMVIRHGIFRLYYLDSEAKESNKGFFCEGQILAPMARSAKEEPSLFFVETMTYVEVYQCRYDQLATLLNNPLRSNRLLYNLAEGLLEDKIRRETMFLQLNAKARYEQFKADFPQLHDRIPLRHIASYLGMTDVTLSRIRSARR